MAQDLLQLKRGNTAKVQAYNAGDGEPVWDNQAKQLYVDDNRIGTPVSDQGVLLAAATTQAAARTVIGALGPGDSTAGNAATATKLQTARNIQTNLGSTVGSAFDGTAAITPGVTGTLAVANGGTGVTTSTGTGSSVLSASPTLTGTPLVPTAAVDTSTTQAASTAFVVGQAGSATPVVDGTAAVGASLRYARQDHVHPTDTSRAPLASPSFTGTPLAPSPAVGTNTTQLATAAMIQAEIANKRAWTTYTPVVTAATNSFTTASATGKYMVAFGICHFQVAITITTKGTGANAIFTLPQAALSGSVGMPFVAREGVTTGKAGTARINAALTGANTLDYTGTAGDLASGGDGSVIYVQGSYPIA